jgi:D-alanyl-D-alanine carboxypeptidase
VLSLPLLLLALAAPAQPTAGFRSQIAPLSARERARMTGVSWRPGCPVGLADLRRVTVTHWDFAGAEREGTLIVNRRQAPAVAKAMGLLYRLRYPIRRMQPVDAYGGSDTRSIDADNTSSFNCRAATGSSRWSEHAYGQAIDLNPLENPYVSNGRTTHAASRRYLDRSRRRHPAEILAGDPVVRVFASIGWGWGGSWSGGVRDYQHFSVSGR